jgi:four helix bundle protein
MPRDPEKLQVFRHAHQLALDVYRLTGQFPAAERYGLTAQLRRAATSVPTNIVEGCRRQTSREYRRFVDVALGSASEVGYLLTLAVDLKFLSEADSSACRDCSNHVERELQNLLKATAQFAP